MPLTLKTVTNRADKIVGAWKQQAGDKTINTYTVASFTALQELVDEAEKELTKAEAKVTEERNKLQTALEALNTACGDVVEGVRGNKDLGGRNGSLYEAMGYVRADEKKSGLTRRKNVLDSVKDAAAAK